EFSPPRKLDPASANQKPSQPPKGKIDALGVFGNGKVAVVSDGPGVLGWSMDSGELLRRYEGATAGVFGLALSPDGRRAVIRVMHQGGSFLRLLDFASGLAIPLPMHEHPQELPFPVGLSRDGITLLMLGHKKDPKSPAQAYLVDLAAGKIVHRLPHAWGCTE